MADVACRFINVDGGRADCGAYVLCVGVENASRARSRAATARSRGGACIILSRVAPRQRSALRAAAEIIFRACLSSTFFTLMHEPSRFDINIVARLPSSAATHAVVVCVFTDEPRLAEIGR